MGNTVVLKPATYTRLSALLFAEVIFKDDLYLFSSSVMLRTFSKKSAISFYIHPFQ